MGLMLLVGAASEGGRALGAAPVTVGRSRKADVTLEDPRVSRLHLELVVVGDCVRVTSLPDAGPFVHAGRAKRSAELQPGDRVVVGDTILAIAAAGGGSLPRGGRTSTRTSRGGVADEARALSAITDLIAALDACDAPPAAELAMKRWAVENLGATACAIATSGEELPAPLRSRDSHDTSSRESLSRAVSAPLDDQRTLSVVLREPGSAIAGRLVAVAATILASRLAALARVESISADNLSLRAAAVGSARAFLGSSSAAEKVAGRIAKLARSDSTALVLGESGTGKTFVSRLVHEASPRAKEPLRILNCAAIPQNLLEAELFGAERGAFSGAVAARVGAFEAVGRGTLVLDEIGELDLAGQAKLLHVLEEKSFERLGSNRAIRLEARLLAATNRDLALLVEQGTFRRDLYFRIAVVTLTVPPLRERGDDIVLLAKQILSDLGTSAGRRVEGFAKKTLDVLREYEWPGNVRELRNVIEHAIVLGDARLIEPDDLPERLSAPTAKGKPQKETENGSVELPARLDWLEEQAIAAALRVTGGNRTRAAEILGINRVTLQNKLGPQKRSRS